MSFSFHHLIELPPVVALLLPLDNHADLAECLLIVLLPCNLELVVEMLPMETLAMLLIKCAFLLAYLET